MFFRKINAYSHYYWSPRLEESIYCFVVDSVCPDVCPFVCHAPSNRFFYFVSRWNRAIFWPSVLHVAIYKTLFIGFWFRPSNATNLLLQICTKSPISRLVWQTDRSCLRLLGGFRGWPIQWNHAKCCGADPCCHGNDIWARREDLVAYRLVITVITLEYITLHYRVMSVRFCPSFTVVLSLTSVTLI